ncbi:MAG: hypothetical protein QG626_551 [Patescibacteria group bacterium]|nr:hypothetical protein [Patescibacteria group bacterium]
MKNPVILIIGAAIGAAIVYFGFAPTTPTENSLMTGPIQYNCELSGGKFKDASCTCPVGDPNTQADMYDKRTGFCQSEIGGPTGDAFQASLGLPYGDYGYYQNIIINLCESSGGNLSGAACICPSGDAYDKSTGQCK